MSFRVITWRPSSIQEHQDLQRNLRRDVANATSGRIFYCIRMYLLLRQDVFFFPFSPVKLQKTIEKASY